MPILRSGAPRARRDGLLHQRADAAPVEHLERIVLEDPLLEIDGDERGLGVVAAVAVGRLREVVGAEREELGVSGQLVGDDAGARQLDHRADLVRQSTPSRARIASAVVLAASRVVCISSLRADARNHHVGARVDARASQLARRFEDRAHLHRVDLGKDDA